MLLKLHSHQDSCEQDDPVGNASRVYVGVFYVTHAFYHKGFLVLYLWVSRFDWEIFDKFLIIGLSQPDIEIRYLQICGVMSVYFFTCIVFVKQGQWMVKCHNCSDHTSCRWTTAMWQPHQCRHPRVPRDRLKKCLAGRQVWLAHGHWTVTFGPAAF